jgi:hypothetical protein
MRSEAHDMAAWPHSELGDAERAGIAMLHRAAEFPSTVRMTGFLSDMILFIEAVTLGG